ncbi:MAG: S-layer homology domain-containing protein, partial [Clostridiales bacterium]|nr:S-layer homology domain-containing protein [Clostridiales bacterium]MDY4036678.1 S-layer homology domain-containing protein [Candidatus Pseudoscilispira sp.]
MLDLSSILIEFPKASTIKRSGKKMKRKFLSIVLALAMVLSLMPAAFADGDPDAATNGDAVGTLQAQINAAADNGATVQLTANTQESIVIPEGKSITLDLQSYILSNETGKHTIENHGTLTIMGTGTVSNDAASKGALANYPGATAILEGGTFTDHNWYTIKNLGEMTIKEGVTVTRTNDDNNSSLIDTGWYGDSGNDLGLTYTSGNPTLTITGGTLSGGMNTVKNDDYGTCVITGGTFNNTKGAVILNWHNMTIRGGTFTGTYDASPVIANGFLDKARDSGNLTIENGTFTASGSGALFGYGKGAKKGGTVSIKNGAFTGVIGKGLPYGMALTGGTFHSNVSEYLPEGYIQNAEGVVQKLDAGNAVAQVGDQYFATLPSAVAAVQGGGTVTMLRDASGAGVGTFKGAADGTGVKNFTIDFGGHTYTCTGPAVGSAGTQSQAFHLEWNGNDQPNAQVILKNGTITSTKDSGVRMIVQNYCDLTLENMIVDGSNLQAKDYTVSNNCGNVTIQDTTIIEPKAGGFAFDSCDYASYTGVCVTVKGNSYIQGAMECTNPNGGAEAAKIIIESGHFTSDPSAYLDEDLIAVASDKAGYTWMVAQKGDNDAKVVPADPEVNTKLPDNVSEEEQKLAESAKEALTLSSESATPPSVSEDEMNAAAAAIAHNNQITSEDGQRRLSEEGIEVTDKAVTIVVQPYLNIVITDASITNDSKTLTLDITPMYQKVATTAQLSGEQPEEIVVKKDINTSGANAVILSSGEMKITEPVTVTLPLPADFVQNDKLNVGHKGYVYAGNVKDNVLTFTNPHGFSEFKLGAVAVATIGENQYGDLETAVNEVRDNETIKLLADNLSATVSREVTFKVDTNSHTGLSLSAGSGYRMEQKENTYTFTYVGGSSGGGSSSTTYAVNVEKAKHGSVDSNRSRASSGTTVTLTVQPDNGYELDELTVTDKNGNELKLTKKSDTKYTFTMPKSAVTVEATFAEESKDTGYSDVSADAWYADAVQYVSDKGMMQGNNGKFMPADKLNRGQMAQVIFNLEGHQTVNYAMSFGDVKGSEWFAEAVRWAASEKIVSGYDNG